jgi:hypothetical protein
VENTEELTLIKADDESLVILLSPLQAVALPFLLPGDDRVDLYRSLPISPD